MAEPGHPLRIFEENGVELGIGNSRERKPLHGLNS